MRIEVDTSGWFDDFEKHSTIGFSNHHQQAILISKELKLQATQLLRSQGKSRAFCKARLFVISFYLLLKPRLDKITQIVIDKDFKGWEAEIINMLVSYFQRHKSRLSADNISFANLKGHQCHNVANGAFRGTFPSVKPKESEFLQLIPVQSKQKK